MKRNARKLEIIGKKRPKVRKFDGKLSPKVSMKLGYEIYISRNFIKAPQELKNPET